jgi:wobble nucleotide-excising tRNase
MIESIRITDIATYSKTSSEVLNNLSKINYLFGSNGSGKTTITRVIADEGNYPKCSVTWKNGTKLQSMVYNRDFVVKNFTQCSELKGIFTLGEKNVDAINKIAAAKEGLDKLTKKIENLNSCLYGTDGVGGKNGELTAQDAELTDKCWAQKLKHDPKLWGAFSGYRNNAVNFKNKVLEELVLNSATIESLSDLEKKAETIFDSSITLEKSILPVETAIVIAQESNPILKKRIIGKEDIDITAMIQKLGNSDWVKDGRIFYDQNDKVCPFCQQKTSEAFTKSLNDYFDETFERDIKAIHALEKNYKTDSQKLQFQIAAIINAPPRFLDVEKLKAKNDLLDSQIATNVQRIATKKKEPSQIINMESVINVTSEINTLIEEANVKISEHNKLISNITQEQSDLKSKVWKYLLEIELKTDLITYKAKKEKLIKEIESIKAQIESTISDKNAKEAEIKNLEKETTSIQPTKNAINSLLSAYGFQGFSVAEAGGMCYKLVRADGTDAKDTLSEGETAFITFLYFYNLLKGSDSESGMSVDRIAVFDDPVSSLDSDILFIVASLIKNIFDEVRNGNGHIKQVFVLTHNVYFHKEVTFNHNRKKKALSEETFWIVRKPGSISKIEKHDSNPIKTSYELLWAEVRAGLAKLDRCISEEIAL